MKISFVIDEPVQGATGGYKMVYMYANSLVDRGHNVSIYYLCRKGRLFSNYPLPFFVKYPIASVLARIGPRWFKLDKRIKGYAIKEISDRTVSDGDVVIATAVNTAIPVSNLSGTKGRKAYFIQDFENWECSDEEVFHTYSLGMKNIVVARWLKEIVDRHAADEAVCIPNGIDTRVFYDRKQTREKHSVVLQYRKAAYKGPEYALKAIRLLSEKYADLKVSMISTDDAPENLPDCCTFYKSITPEAVAQINNCSEVFICTSVEEGYGLPGLEAMACGCAVCSSAYRGIFEYAVDGVNALLSPVKDAEAMVENVGRVFEDKKLREALVKEAAKTAQEKSHRRMAEQFENAIQDR